MNRHKADLWVALLTGVWAVLNLVTAISTDLIGDEAYYWVWSRDLSFGYFDHPPLVAVLIRLGTSVFGQSELGVRLLTVLLHWGALNLLWRVVRTEQSDLRSALRYCLVVFSIPVLHLYGFITTPDAPLFFTLVVGLWTFVQFCRHEQSWWWAVALGVAVAAMGYSKYHAVLVVLGLVLSYPKLVRSGRFYVAAAVAAVLMVPHLWWQASHDWVSFRYHLSDRNNPFEWRFVGEYFANLLGVYNPFLVAPFLWFLLHRWGKDRTVRAVAMMASVTLLFFLYSTCRGDVQPQWLLPIVPALVLLVMRHSEQSARFARYVVWGAGVMSVLLLGVRVVVFTRNEPMGTVDLWGSRAMIQKAERTLGDVELLVFEGNYATGSKFRFYGTIPVSVVPSLYSRSSQYQFEALPARLAGKRTAYEVGDKGHRLFARDSLRRLCVGVRVPVYDTILFDTVSCYLPADAVRIEERGNRLHITNPYPYPIQGVELLRHTQLPYRRVVDRSLGMVCIPAHSSIDTVIEERGVGRYGYSLQRPLHGAWFNSPIYTPNR